MNRPPSLLAHWTREEANRLGSGTVVIVPVGALEQHGPHLPLATDSILVERVAREAAALVSGTVVAPTISIGSSDHHLPYGGTASVRTTTLLAMLTDTVESLLASGFGGVFLLNGHGGNAEIIQLVARDTGILRHSYAGAASYFQLAAGALKLAGAEEIGDLPGHAGAFETSMMLAVDPALVDTTRIPTRERPPEGWPQALAYRLGSPDRFRAPDGFSDNPSAASADLGQQFLSLCVAAARDAIGHFVTRIGQGTLSNSDGKH